MKHLTVKQAAQTLGVTSQTVTRWLREGKITGEKLPGKTATSLIPIQEIKRIQEQRKR